MRTPRRPAAPAAACGTQHAAARLTKRTACPSVAAHTWQAAATARGLLNLRIQRSACSHAAKEITSDQSQCGRTLNTLTSRACGRPARSRSGTACRRARRRGMGGVDGTRQERAARGQVARGQVGSTPAIRHTHAAPSAPAGATGNVCCARATPPVCSAAGRLVKQLSSIKHHQWGGKTWQHGMRCGQPGATTGAAARCTCAATAVPAPGAAAAGARSHAGGRAMRVGQQGGERQRGRYERAQLNPGALRVPRYQRLGAGEARARSAPAVVRQGQERGRQGHGEGQQPGHPAGGAGPAAS